jgi:glucosamine-6-phosphate deaminase
MTAQPIRATVAGSLPVVQYATNGDLGAAAAVEAAEILRAAVEARGEANAILATGNSQLTFLRAIVTMPGIPWDKINLFHMDEYVELPAGHPASFPAFLRREIVDKVHPKAFFPVKAEGDVEAACREYEALLRQHPTDLTVMGIGENGHLAFNDPPYALFDDPQWVKMIQLDERSRRQQVGEGHFGGLDEVPTHAVTVTIPALLAAKRVLVLVPEARKAEAVKASLLGPITEDCPGSILREQAHAKLFLDADSASLLPDSLWTAAAKGFPG